MRQSVLCSEKLEFVVSTKPLLLERVVLRENPDACGTIASEIFWVESGGRRISASEFSITSVSEHDDGRYKLLRIDMEHGSGISAAAAFLADIDGSVELILQLWNTADLEARFVGLGMPFLSDGKMLGLKEAAFRAPNRPFESSRGETLLDLHPACVKPMSFVRGDGCGFDILFDVPKESNTQSCTPELPYIRSLENLKSYHTQVRLNRYPAVVMQMKIKAVKDGWTETFQEIKKNARRKVDLDLYGRPDLKWYQDTCLHHFAYVFSEEVYDYTHDQVDVVRLLEAGKEFGGYDIICLWHQYPRLGVDERSQWDFFRDFPGGLAGIASIAQKCHENGVKLMLPYKPWDAPAHMTQNGTAEALAQIILDTDVDGFFLDTMSSVPEKFRLEADKVKPGCVFCTELPPENGRVLEVLNGSWQQSEPLPYQVPILRYVFPEHRSHFISRWSIGADRDNMLKKAMMNGCGLVVWQDVFGAWLPYTEEQKEAVRKWKGESGRTTGRASSQATLSPYGPPCRRISS